MVLRSWHSPFTPAMGSSLPASTSSDVEINYCSLSSSWAWGAVARVLVAGLTFFIRIWSAWGKLAKIVAIYYYYWKEICGNLLYSSILRWVRGNRVPML